MYCRSSTYSHGPAPISTFDGDPDGHLDVDLRLIVMSTCPWGRNFSGGLPARQHGTVGAADVEHGQIAQVDLGHDRPDGVELGLEVVRGPKTDGSVRGQVQLDLARAPARRGHARGA